MSLINIQEELSNIEKAENQKEGELYGYKELGRAILSEERKMNREKGSDNEESP